MSSHQEIHQPPPPTQPNSPTPAANGATAATPPSNDLMGINICAGLVAVATVAHGFLSSGTTAYGIGSAIGSLVLPVIIAALIGWGNDRRARIAFILVGSIALTLRVIGSIA